MEWTCEFGCGHYHPGIDCEACPSCHNWSNEPDPECQDEFGCAAVRHMVANYTNWEGQPISFKSIEERMQSDSNQ